MRPEGDAPARGNSVTKPTFADIARHAGVGTATVERVLNGRGGVSPATAAKVVVAARALDYPKRLPELHRGLMRIEVMLVRPESAFFRRLAGAFERINATLDAAVRIHRSFVDEADPKAIAARIATNELRRAALICAVPDHPAVRRAVADAAAAGMPVVNVVTRVAGAGELVGIDNAAAGRTAALFLARMERRGGTAVALCHPIYEVHRARVRGFSEVLAATRENLVLRWVGFGDDEPHRCAELLHDALVRWPDLVGLYNAGNGNGALADTLRRHARDVFFVGHELTDDTAAALRDGVMDVVVDQAPEAQARRAVEVALHRLGLTEMAPDTAPIRFVTVTKENL